MIKINGAPIPAPSDYSVTVMDIELGKIRTASGLMVREKIATKRKLELVWRYLTREQMESLLAVVGSTFFVVEFPDPQSVAPQIGTFSVEDRSAGALDYDAGNVRWTDIKMTFVER